MKTYTVRVYDLPDGQDDPDFDDEPRLVKVRADSIDQALMAAEAEVGWPKDGRHWWTELDDAAGAEIEAAGRA